MRSRAFCFLMMLMALSFSCGKDHQGLPTGFEYSPPPTPTNLLVAGGEERGILSWSYPAAARASIKKFNVFQYFEAYDMVQLVGTTTDTFYVDSMLIGNLVYCYRVSAVDAKGFEGWRTAQMCAFVKSAH